MKTVKRPQRTSSPNAEGAAGTRPIWTGLISFGLVNVPVTLHSAVKPEIHAMNCLRKDDLCPISYKKVCR